MPVKTYELKLSTTGDNDTRDITEDVRKFIKQSGLREGSATIFVPGSTGGITTIEFEPGVISDLDELLERLVPRRPGYKHDMAWGDGNAHSHMRAALIGPSLTVPFTEASPLLGTWQQIVFVDFDNRSRSRRIIIQVTGE